MQYSIDWNNELVASLRWVGIATVISLIGLLIVGFLIARFTEWGRQFWRVNHHYFADPDKRVATWLLIVVLTVLSLLGVRVTVLISYFSNDLYTSLQTVAQGLTTPGPNGQQLRDAGETAFWHSMIVFGIVATVHVIRTEVEYYVGSLFDIRWRESLTRTMLGDWLSGRAYYRNRFAPVPGRKTVVGIHPGVDNPDQRIEADIDNVTTATQTQVSFRTLMFSSFGSSTNGVIPAIASIVSFTKILWDLSGPLNLWGVEISRAMVWLVFVYVLIATVVAFSLGRPLIRLSFWRERLTANFRYGLVRIRDGAENVAFYRGEAVEQRGLLAKFRSVVRNFWQYVYWYLAFDTWNLSVTQLSVVFPYLIQASRFFSGAIKLGDVQQTASAFGNVHDSLSFFRNFYNYFADLRASIVRLDGLQELNGISRTMPAMPTVDQDRVVTLDHVAINTPAGDPLVTGLSLSLRPGQALAIKGRSGAGKTTLLRGLAGLWPYIDGQFTRPEGDRTLFLSQMPYIPLGDLRTAVAYPALPDDIGDDAIKAALAQVFLSNLTERLDEEEDWAKVLSPGEQQRVAFARILLTRPQVVFMDEATSAVDEGLEYALYQLIRTELPETIVVSVSHRSTTDQHHTEVLELTGGGAWDIRPVAVT